MPPRVDFALTKLENNRMWIYLAVFGLWNIYQLWCAYVDSTMKGLELELLQDSFEVDNSRSLMALAESFEPDDDPDNEVVVNAQTS